jgi:hypothetical protein
MLFLTLLILWDGDEISYEPATLRQNADDTTRERGDEMCTW